MYDPAKECEKVIMKLKKICEDKEISYYALAKNTGMSTSTIYNIMSGKNIPQIFTLFKLCNVLGVSINSLIDDSGEIENEEVLYQTELPEDDETLLDLYKRLPEIKKEWIRTYIDMVRQYKIKE